MNTKIIFPLFREKVYFDRYFIKDNHGTIESTIK